MKLNTKMPAERFILLCVYLGAVFLFDVTLIVGFFTGRLSVDEYIAQAALTLNGLAALLIKLGGPEKEQTTITESGDVTVTTTEEKG